MNDHYRMRVKLWGIGVANGKGQITPAEAQAIERLWDLEEWSRRDRIHQRGGGSP